GVPNAPLKSTWHEMAFRRAVRWSAENGFDRVAWTTGEQQADRFDLSAQIERIDYGRVGDGLYDIEAYDHNRRRVIAESEVPITRIEQLVGKEIAKKVEDGATEFRQWKQLRDVDLKVGGEG